MDRHEHAERLERTLSLGLPGGREGSELLLGSPPGGGGGGGGPPKPGGGGRGGGGGTGITACAI